MKQKEINFKEIKKRAEAWVKIQDKHKYKYYHYYVGAIETWLGDVYNFCSRKTWAPTAKINMNIKQYEVKEVKNPHFMISVCFSNKLYMSFLMELDKMYKPYEVILKYGFRGYSRGGRNGVFFVRKQDINLNEAIDNFLNQEDHRVAIFGDLGIKPQNFDKL